MGGESNELPYPSADATEASAAQQSAAEPVADGGATAPTAFQARSMPDRPASPPLQHSAHRDAPAPRRSTTAVVIGFSGSLRELLRLCHRTAAGTIIDLAGGSVHESQQDTTIPEAEEEDEEAAVPAESVRLCANIINSHADLVRVGLNSLRLAQASTDDQSGSRTAASTSSSAVVRSLRDGRGSADRPRPQSPRSLTIAGTPEAQGAALRDWNTFVDAAAVGAAHSTGSAGSASVGDIPGATPWGAAVADGGALASATPGSPSYSGLRMDVVDRVPWRHSLGRATHKHDGSTSSASADKLSQRTNPSLHLAPIGPCVSPVTGDFGTPARATTLAKPSSVRLVGDRITVRNGNIVLPDGGALVLEGSIELDNMTVRGDSGSSATAGAGTPLVLVAAAAAVAMHSVVVADNAGGHGVGIGERATLGLYGCDISGNGAGGVAVAGRGASLTADATVLDRNGASGAHVACGASAAFVRCTFSGNWAAGIAAADAGTRVTVEECVSESNATGVEVHGGAEVVLTECALERNAKGVLALNAGTVLRVQGGAISGGGEAVAARDGAEVHVSGLDVADCDKAFSAADPGSALHAHACQATRVAAHGAHATAGAAVTLTDCHISACAAHGACGQDLVTTITAHGTAFAQNGSTGVTVSGGAAAELTACSVKFNKVAGVIATGESSTAALTDTDAEHNGTIGVFGGSGAAVHVRGGRLAHNGASGAEIRDAASRLDVHDATVTGNARVALYAHSGAEALCVRCTIRAGADCGVLCGGRANIDVPGGAVRLDSCDADAGSNVQRHGGSLVVVGTAATNGDAARS